MIEFRSVTKQFPDGTVAVEDFNLVIPAHKTTVFVGSSGCGKTTLSHDQLMVDPTRGSIQIDSEDISGPTCEAPPQIVGSCRVRGFAAS
jgi:osmoprotectant transport system ATP-binding protein